MTEGIRPEQDIAFDPDRTAVVLIEFQRQWTDSGLYNLLIRRSLNRRNVVERTRETVQTARAAGVTIVHAPLRIDPDQKKGWLATVNYPTLLALRRSLREGLPASTTRFAGTTAVPVGSAVSTGVPSE